MMRNPQERRRPPGRRGLVIAALELCAFPWVAAAQGPTIAPGGVVTASGFTQPVSPGSIASVFGSNLAPVTASASSSPLPLAVFGVSVLVNGVAAPLYFVSPSQINFQAPSAVQSAVSLSTYGTVQVAVRTASGLSSPVAVPIASRNPGLFSLDGSGCGPAAALNVGLTGDVSVNTPANSAAPGDTISLFGTGLGLALYPQAPPDGQASSGLVTFFDDPVVLVDGVPAGVSSYLYRGLAPGLVGVDQIDVTLPADLREGCAIPITLYAPPFLGLTATISVHKGHGPCADPPVQTYGGLSVVATYASGTASDGETDSVNATLPSGPGLPPAPAPSSAPYPFGGGFVPIAAQRTCSIAGTSTESVGPIQVRPPAGTALTMQPSADGTGVTYSAQPPRGFVGPGSYSLSATTSSEIGFTGVLQVPQAIKVTTDLSPGTQIDISSRKPWTVAWTGGSPGSLVRVTIYSELELLPQFTYADIDATVGAVTFEPSPSNSPPSLNGLSPPLPVRVVVEELPSTATSIPSYGLTSNLLATWSYRYVFDGLSLK